MLEEELAVGAEGANRAGGGVAAVGDAEGLADGDLGSVEVVEQARVVVGLGGVLPVEEGGFAGAGGEREGGGEGGGVAGADEGGVGGGDHLPEHARGGGGGLARLAAGVLAGCRTC